MSAKAAASCATSIRQVPTTPYGIHGTPFPERIGRAESHGCFRLASWNAVKLHSMCSVGTSIVIEK